MKLVGHEAHIRIDVTKEVLITRAEIVETVLAGFRSCEAVFGALAIAGKPDVALAAIGDQRRLFRVAEQGLLP